MDKILGSFFSSVRGNIKTRISDPLVGTFVCSWALCNWDRLAVLLFGSGIIEGRVEKIASEMAFLDHPSLIYSNYDLLALPIALTIGYVFLFPKISIWVVNFLADTDVARYEAVVNREIRQAVKQRDLNEERLLGDPGKQFLAQVVEEKLAKEKAIREKMEAEAEDAKAKVEQTKAMAQAEKENAAKAGMEKHAAELELKKKEHQYKLDADAFSVSETMNRAALQANAYTSSYMFIEKLGESISQDGVNLSLSALTNILAAIFGYRDYQELLNDKSFNNDKLKELKYVLCDSDYLSSRLLSILSDENLEDESLDSGWVMDHIQSLFDDLPYEFHFADSLEVAIYERIEAGQFNLIHSEEFASAQAGTDTILDEFELHDKEHSFDNESFVVEISGSASGHHRKEEGMPSPGVDFTVTATLAVGWGKYGLKDYEVEIFASPEDWSE
jgi:hypothetical protein